jgi:hypothetical protein
MKQSSDVLRLLQCPFCAYELRYSSILRRDRYDRVEYGLLLCTGCHLEYLVSLIASTHSRSGLHVRSELDRRRYPDGVTVSDAQMATVRLTRHEFQGDWNFTIHPASQRRRR